jgi:hypothetical protein
MAARSSSLKTRSLKRAAVIIVLAAVLGSAGMYVGRGPILRGLGSMLASDDPVAGSDAIVVTVDSGAAGILEAADLIRAGIAPRVAVFAGPPDAVSAEFLKRGIRYEDKTVTAVRLLKTLGVAEVERIATPVNGTEAEGRVLRGWCSERSYRSVVVVTTADHARRVGRVLRREVAPPGDIRVLIRGSRYSEFDPERWWSTRDGVRIGIVEAEKLLLDFLRHPLS